MLLEDNMIWIDLRKALKTLPLTACWGYGDLVHDTFAELESVLDSLGDKK